MTLWHKGLAGISALLLVPVLILIAISDTVSTLARIVITAALIIMTYCIYLISRSNGEPHNFLLIQSAYFAVFLIPIMAIGYLLMEI